MKTIQMKPKAGFTLVELLVVIGIIAMLLGILMPALKAVQLNAQRTKCLSNLQNIWLAMELYSNENRGLIIPLGPLEDGTASAATMTDLNGTSNPPFGQDSSQFDNSGNTLPALASDPYIYMTLGTNVYPWMRWPARILSEAYAPVPPVGQRSQYLRPEPDPNTNLQGDPTGVWAAPWTSRLMVCPSDPQPGAAHSYLFNQHIVQDESKVLRYFTKPPSNLVSSQVVVVGEKRSDKDDYYMEQNEFPIDGAVPQETHVELYRHGVKLGSNYLYLDGHAQNSPPNALSEYVDPWDITPVPSQGSQTIPSN